MRGVAEDGYPDIYTESTPPPRSVFSGVFGSETALALLHQKRHYRTRVTADVVESAPLWSCGGGMTCIRVASCSLLNAAQAQV